MQKVWRSKELAGSTLTCKGQPIRLVSIPSGPSAGRRNQGAAAPGRSLFERMPLPAGRSRSDSPVRHSDVSGPPPSNVDRYIPGRGSRSRSPRPRQREGRRPGARRERGERRGGGRGGGGGSGGERLARDGRPRKTQEELDAEMEDYWGAKEIGTEAAATTAAVDDVEMVE